jgi:hypothetical protein
MTSCEKGKYCQGYLLSTYSSSCEAGYLCLRGATKPNPDDLDGTGYQCTPGYYCESGTTALQPCPIGTYNDKYGASNSSYCLPCPSGKVCQTLALAQPTNVCSSGFYCTTDGLGNFIQTPCEPGYKCPNTTMAKQRCLPGTY